MVAFAAFFLIGLVWAQSMPLFAGPDEPQHTVKAAGTVRGQLVGEHVPGEQEWNRTMEVPAILGSAESVLCWAFIEPDPATCAVYEGSTSQLAEVATSASRHPPFYYAVVGIITWLGTSGFYVRLMRLFSLAIAAWFAAETFASTISLPNPRTRLAGLALTFTPSIVAWQALINPSVTEIAGSICLVSTLLVIGSDPSGVNDAVIRRAGMAAIVMTLSRHLAPLWLAAIGLTMLVLFGGAVIRQLLARRSARRWMGASIAAAIIQSAWVVIVRPLSNIDDGFEPLSFMDSVRGVIGMGNRNLTHIIGVFGWNNPRLPYFVEVTWIMMLGALLAAGFALGTRRGVRALLIALGATVGVPIVLEIYQASTYGGFPWQARYTVPIAVMVPLIATHLVASSEAGAWIARSRVIPMIGLLVWIGHGLSYWAAIRRFSVGTGGSWVFMFEPVWRAPLLPMWAWFGLFIITSANFVWHFSGQRARAEIEPVRSVGV